MSLTLAEKNSLLRDAVSERLDRKLHREEPDVLRHVTAPRHLSETDEVSSQPATDDGYDPEKLEDATEKLAQFYRDQFAAFSRQLGDGITHQQPTTSQRFLDLLDEMRRLHESKSADYGSETDPLANIRQGAEFVGIEPWRGCMVRIADKVQRLKTFCRTGRLVHEGVRDTLLDLSAYSLLAIVLFDEGLKDAD
jgi:hypothetical protein